NDQTIAIWMTLDRTGTTRNMVFRFLDKDTIQRIDSKDSIIMRRCVSLQASRVFSCGKSYIYMDLIILLQYTDNEKLKKSIEEETSKIVNIVEGGDLNQGCQMLQALKQEIAQRL